ERFAVVLASRSGPQVKRRRRACILCSRRRRNSIDPAWQHGRSTQPHQTDQSRLLAVGQWSCRPVSPVQGKLLHKAQWENGFRCNAGGKGPALFWCMNCGFPALLETYSGQKKWDFVVSRDCDQSAYRASEV